MLLELHDIRSGYGSHEVLHGVSLGVDAGEAVAILGPNGSGKSTLVKTVMDLSTLHSGTIKWSGADMKSKRTWERVHLGMGYMPQVNNVFSSLTVRDQLDIAGIRLSTNVRRSRVREIEDMFPILAERRAVRASDLSGGERRALALAATLVEAPRLLVLDEPTTDLSPIAIDTMFDLIEKVKQRLDVSVLLVEQNVRQAIQLADRVCILVRGEKVLESPASDVTEQELGRLFLEYHGSSTA